MKKTTVYLALALTALALGACGGDEQAGGGKKYVERVGPLAQCEEKLEAKMTDRYLREWHEIASVDALTLASQINKTCRDVPTTFPVSDAALLAGDALVQMIRDQG